jgi:LPS-assembly protein
MKNRKKLLLLSLFLFFCINLEKAFSQEFKFEASEILISDDGSNLIAKDGVEINSDNGIQITAESFEYNKENLILLIEKNVEIFDPKNNLKIFGEKFIYDKNNEKIFSETNLTAILENKYNLNAKELNYFVLEKRITSNKEILLTDNLNNKIESNNFEYLITKKIFKVNEFVYTDKIGNKYLIDTAILDTDTNQLAGKDLEIIFNKKSFGNSNNDPRIKGNAIITEEDKSIITKGVFTTCKKNDSCPPWEMSAEKIVHNKTKKTINYKNAFLKLYNKKVFYFPKFFHPDPTVKRQSGFLIPTFADDSNTGANFVIPYFYVISDSEDFTLKPRFFSYDSILLNSEYRKVTKNSSHIIDVGFKNKASSTDSKSHLFSNSKINLTNTLFEESDVEINIERVNNDQYLKVYDINSPIVRNTSTLNSFINFNGINEDLFFQADFEIFEDTSKKESSDRYEYIFPNLKIDKKIDLEKELNGYLSFNSAGYIKQYDTNVQETRLENNLNYNSFPFYSSKGFLSDYSFILKNTNTELKNSTTSNNESNIDLLTAGMFTARYPLKKIEKNLEKFLTPKISFRYSPTETKNISDADRRVDVNNIYSLNRLGSLESGASLTLGSEYLIRNSSGMDIFSLELASVLRDKINEDLPKKSTLEKKTSNIFGNLKFKPSKYFNVEYNFSLDNNLDNSTYDQIKAEISINNFVNSFEFLEETGPLGNQGYWSNKTTFYIDSQNSLSFNKRRNTKTNLNEFYNLIYQYQNDCLTAAIEYNKDYYNDGDLKPSEELFFSISIVPFTSVNSPNIN